MMRKQSWFHKLVLAQQRDGSRSLLLMLAVFAMLFFLLTFLLLVALPSRNFTLFNTVFRSKINSPDSTHANMTMEILSWAPRAFLFHNFLSADECDYLITIARPKLAKSTVVDPKTGMSVESRERTSSGTFLTRGENDIIKRIESRIACVSFIPVDHGEGIQILHYAVGEKYDAHHDYFADQYNIRNGGNRIATMLMYLETVEKGGETVFPMVNVEISKIPWWDDLSDCGKSGLSVRPRKGDAILFWSMNPDASFDPLSMHGSCPVIKGDKWSATKWMRIGSYKTF